MCGRFVLHSTGDLASELQQRFGLAALPGRLQERYNIAPTQAVPVIVDGPRGRIVDGMEWGIFAPWASDADAAPRPINARMETIADKPMFRGPVRHHRCIVPASGFYEWQDRPDGKQPWLLSGHDGRLLAMAGIFSEWTGADGSVRMGCAIVTAPASAEVAPIHQRMPLLLSDPASEDAWLDTRAGSAGTIAGLLTPPADGLLQAWPVGRAVGSASVDEPSLIEPIELAPPPPTGTPTLFDA